MSAPSEALRPVNAGMETGMPLKNAKLMPMINDQGIPVLLVFPN